MINIDENLDHVPALELLIPPSIGLAWNIIQGIIIAIIIAVIQ